MLFRSITLIIAALTAASCGVPKDACKKWDDQFVKNLVVHEYEKTASRSKILNPEIPLDMSKTNPRFVEQKNPIWDMDIIATTRSGQKLRLAAVVRCDGGVEFSNLGDASTE